MPTLVPYLTFRDGDASLAFLTDGLGFEVLAVQRDDAGAVQHAELRRGDAVILGGGGTPPADPPTAPGLYLVTDDVDALFARSVEAGARVEFPPHDTEWGSRRARVRDLDGIEWSFGTYEPGAAAA